MKKFLTLFKTAAFLLLVAVTVVSCKKDDDDPDYVGTWVVLGTFNDGETNFEMKDVLTLSSGKFEEKMQLKNPVNNTWLDYMGMKGTLTVNGNKINVTITEIGLSAINPVTQTPTGVITYYKSTDTEFSELVEGFGIDLTYQSEYSIQGSEITIKTDLNGDGDFNDEDELSTYTRQ